jgi:hypothetical protein
MRAGPDRALLFVIAWRNAGKSISVSRQIADPTLSRRSAQSIWQPANLDEIVVLQSSVLFQRFNQNGQSALGVGCVDHPMPGLSRSCSHAEHNDFNSFLFTCFSWGRSFGDCPSRAGGTWRRQSAYSEAQLRRRRAKVVLPLVVSLGVKLTALRILQNKMSLIAFLFSDIR